MEHSIKSLGKSVGKSVGKSPTSHSSHTVLFNQLKQLKYTVDYKYNTTLIKIMKGQNHIQITLNGTSSAPQNAIKL